VVEIPTTRTFLRPLAKKASEEEAMAMRAWLRWVLLLAAGMAAALPAPARDNAAILRIEQGLRPLAIIDGQPQPKWNIIARMQHYKVPGVGIAVISGGKVAWTRGYGVVAVNGKPVNSETLFQAASISKPVTALMALRLVDEGKLSLDEDVNLKLRSWKVPENEFTRSQKVTLRRLLNHSAGLTVHGFDGYAAGKAVPSLLDILDGRKPANSEAVRVEAVPGTKWNYSGGGYVAVQQLLMDVAGKPFPELAREKVLGPLGMAHSTFQQPLPASLESNAAAGHDGDGVMIEGRWHTYPELAPAGLWTTPSDLARVVLELQHGGRILQAATQDAMLTKLLYDYGLGVGLGEKSGRKSFSHSGGNAGFNGFLFGYLDGDGVVVMTNGDNGWPLIEEIMRSISAEYRWPDYKQRNVIPVEPAVLQGYAGRYVFPSKTEIAVSYEGGKLLASYMGEKKFELLPETPDAFFTTDYQWPQTFRFTRGGDNGVELSLGGKSARRQAAAP
jgi:CubicO group peptidase (beta-lactamase class C family)